MKQIFLKKSFKRLLHKFKKTIKVVTRGDPWVSPFMKQNFNRTKFMKSLQREDVIYGMGGRIRT